MMPFPVLEGGKGKPTDTFGGIDGWIVANGASDAAIEFLTYLNSPESQSRQAAAGTYIPTAKGTSDALTNPYMKQIGAYLAASEFHQLFLDQALGADVGATFNDLSADLAQGVVSPEDAATMLKEAWEFQ